MANVSPYPGQGHRWITDSFDVYLFDPLAATDDDLAVPSDQAMLHIRSRVSGEMLPYLCLAKMSDCLAHVKARLGELMSAVTPTDEMISRLFPCRQAPVEEEGPFGRHLPKSTLPPVLLESWPDTLGEAMEVEPLAQTGPIEGYPHRLAFHEAQMAPLSKLHVIDGNMTLPEATYRAILENLAAYRTSLAPTDAGRCAVDKILDSWGREAVIRDGSVEFPRATASSSPASSDHSKLEFQATVRGLLAYRLHHDDDSAGILDLGECLARLAHLRGRELGDITSGFSDLMVSWGGNVPFEQAFVRTGGAWHPMEWVAADMIFGDNPYVTVEQAMDSRVFEADYAATPTLSGRREKPHIDALRFISRGRTAQGVRRAFQFAERMGWAPSIFDDQDNPFCRSSSLYRIATAAEVGRLVYAGCSLRAIVRQALDGDFRISQADRVRLPGRKLTHLFLANVIAMDRLNTPVPPAAPPISVVLHTEAGERIEMTLGSSLANVGRSREERELWYMTYRGVDGHPIFEIDKLGLVQAHQERDVYIDVTRIFNDSLAVLQLPPGRVASYKELAALLMCQATNRAIGHVNRCGFLANLDGARDEQGRKVKRKNYQGWIGTVLALTKAGRSLQDYESEALLADSDVLVREVMRAVLLNVAKQAGLAVGTDYTLDALADTRRIDHNRAVTLNGWVLDMSKLGLSIYRDSSSLNYNRWVRQASRVHRDTLRLKRNYLPQVEVEWEPATAILRLGEVAGREYIVMPLHSYRAIHQEGAAMNHGAGAYAMACMAGAYYLWSIRERQPDGSLRRFSTLGMTTEYAGIEVEQHFGINNAMVEGPVRNLVEAFANRVSECGEALCGRQFDDEDSNAASHLPPVDFKPTFYQAVPGITSEQITEIITNYQWQSEGFVHDALAVLGAAFGQDQVVGELIGWLEQRKCDAEDRPDLKDRMTKMQRLLARQMMGDNVRQVS